MLLLAATLAFTPPQQEAIKSAVGKALKDPFTAQYEWPEPKSATVYCGWVNARNGFGAYDGFRPFMVLYYIGKQSKALTVVQTEMSPPIVGQMCAESGYRMVR
jgi:hypothetical protein